MEIKNKKAKIKSRLMNLGLYTALFFCISAVNFPAQTGGTFQLEQTVIAAGGGRNSGGSFALDATVGQTLAGGVSQGVRFSVQNGFWTFNIAPTAALVSIGGRVITADGRGIRNARVLLTAPDGTARLAATGAFGYYRFGDVAVGETYVLTVFSKRFVFDNPTLIVSVMDELRNLDFVAARR
jgi:hypothetical protein